MLKIEITSILSKPTAELIESEEKFYRVKFPSSYIDFNRENNGGIPITNTFRVEENELVLERFVCFLGDIKEEHQHGWLDIGVVIEPIYERLTNDGDAYGLPIIPIGILFAGDLLCLDFRNDENEPEMCIWYHEQSKEFEPVTKKVANNFAEFLDMLK